ncbi:hypothetical protein AVEN_13819-1 [Araneus ventricosus]|uniref:Sushi domain-containing protein n=1 Tax=Araneus ventricosus TaxID=182803 RepID=A0A4Y2TV18_ARAVE|nr:hypothetical protein AVEN_13819-1 [Araneus ventricosus]
MAFISAVRYSLLALLGLSIRPDAPPTEATIGSTCSGLHVTDGSVNCFNTGDKTVCRVECDGEDKGEFTCTEDEGWTPELPTCAKPIKGTDDVPPPPLDNGCPNDAMCAKSCKNRGYKSGKCYGNTCRCR